jgi:hypothetical protein
MIEKSLLVSLLRAIRDEPGLTVANVAQVFGLSLARNSHSGLADGSSISPHPAGNVWEVLDALRKVGLIEVDERGCAAPIEARLSTTAQFSSLQSTLGISLTNLQQDLSRVVLRVEPFHGVPIRPFRMRAFDIFVISPFDDDSSELYEHTIKLAAAEVGLSCGRADDLFSNNAIMKDVWECIVRAKLVVAECTGRNPNVFYELGLAHAIGQPTLLLARDPEVDLPFDVRHIRAIKYAFTPPGLRQLRTTLLKTFTSELKLVPSPASSGTYTPQMSKNSPPRGVPIPKGDLSID